MCGYGVASLFTLYIDLYLDGNQRCGGSAGRSGNDSTGLLDTALGILHLFFLFFYLPALSPYNSLELKENHMDKLCISEFKNGFERA